MCFVLDPVCSGREVVQVLDVYLSWVVPARIIPAGVLFLLVASAIPLRVGAQSVVPLEGETNGIFPGGQARRLWPCMVC